MGQATGKKAYEPSKLDTRLVIEKVDAFVSARNNHTRWHGGHCFSREEVSEPVFAETCDLFTLQLATGCTGRSIARCAEMSRTLRRMHMAHSDNEHVAKQRQMSKRNADQLRIETSQLHNAHRLTIHCLVESTRYETVPEIDVVSRIEEFAMMLELQMLDELLPAKQQTDKYYEAWRQKYAEENITFMRALLYQPL